MVTYPEGQRRISEPRFSTSCKMRFFLREKGKMAFVQGLSLKRPFSLSCVGKNRISQGVENWGCRGFFFEKAVFPFSRGKNGISQGVENWGSLISVPLALRYLLHHLYCSGMNFPKAMLSQTERNPSLRPGLHCINCSWNNIEKYAFVFTYITCFGNAFVVIARCMVWGAWQRWPMSAARSDRKRRQWETRFPTPLRHNAPDELLSLAPPNENALTTHTPLIKGVEVHLLN